ncbi:MAG: hypothetical protein DRP63_02245 [Planctomycetota bacterium]|nr:MAG: hypothetical protein DRP63_02245 [Planctomycetota bacterium]
MRCEEARALFGDYFEGGISEEQREALIAHLGSCAGCRAEFEKEKRVWALVGSGVDVEVGSGFVGRVVERVEKRRFLKRLAGWAVCVLLTAALSLLLVEVRSGNNPWLQTVTRDKELLEALDVLMEVEKEEIEAVMEEEFLTELVEWELESR